MGVIRLNFSLGTLKGYIEKNIEVLETTGIPLTLFGMFSVTEKKLVNPIGEPVAVEELIKYALQTEQFACKISDIETLNTQNENTEQIKRAKT